MILTVTLNAAIDKRYVVDDCRMGEVNRVKECTYVPGGKGLNVSRAGAPSTARSPLPQVLWADTREIILKRLLKPFGIKSAFYHVEGESRSCINIWMKSTMCQTEFLEPGFTLTEEDFRGFEEKFRELVKDADVVAMSGSVPKDLTEPHTQDWCGS